MATASSITLREVATRAKVSRMTVSLALRDDPSISARTRRRVADLAQRLGYRPDPDIAELMAKIRAKKPSQRSSNVIAYLTAHADRLSWKSEPTQRMYFDGAEKYADQCGYQLKEFWLRQPGMTDQRLAQIIRNRGIEGCIVAPIPGTEPLFAAFNWEDFSVVALGYSLRQPTLHRACNHQYHSMLLLANRLYAQGYRRVGLAVSAEADERVNHSWRAGYLASQNIWASGGEIAPLIMEEWSREQFHCWRTTQNPDAIITIGERVALWLMEAGVRVPRDVGIANVDLRPTMAGMTGIDQNSTQVGSAAAALLISLMREHSRGPAVTPRVVMVEGSFVPGRSTRGAGVLQ
jgi:LacI family transcriptional regulator